MGMRYSRQMLFKPIGDEGQERLKNAHVVVVGCGALGSPLSETLVRAGVGRLTIADRDYVEMSNLQRQQLFTEQDALNGVPKVIAAARRLKEIRQDCEIRTVLDHVDGPIMEELVEEADLIMDATDNFETRLLMNMITTWKNGNPLDSQHCASVVEAMSFHSFREDRDVSAVCCQSSLR